VNIRKERDILEYFPLALFSIGMIVKSGGSLEEGLHFVAKRDFGRVTDLFQQVLDHGLRDNLKRGLDSIERRSSNPLYKEAIDTMMLYARHGTSIGDRLIAIGNKMQREAVRLRRNHLVRVRNALIPQTLTLLCAIPFLLIVFTLVLTRPFPMQAGEPPVKKEHVEIMIMGWVGILVVVYPFLFLSYIFRNPVFVTPRLNELRRMFGTSLDAPISRFLDTMANHIEMGWSLEMAFTNTLPAQISTGMTADEALVKRLILNLNDNNLSFEEGLYRMAYIVNHRKFDLTVEFIEMARKNRYASISETLHNLAESFWGSHLIALQYQSIATILTSASLILKGITLVVLGVFFPFYFPIFILFFALDAILMLLSVI